jgi:hypothetical protein
VSDGVSRRDSMIGDSYSTGRAYRATDGVAASARRTALTM